MTAIGTFLEGCRLARRQTLRNLTVFPLLGTEAFAADYLLLEAALAEGRVEIRELDHAGSVPELRLVNRADRPVLVVEGEELVGAKQNRVVNTTILVAAGSELVIPVSCVEQGRWGYRSDVFSSGQKVMHFSLRRDTRDGVRCSLDRGAGYRSDQGRVWDNIAMKTSRMRVDSPTMAAAEVFERYGGDLDAFVKGFVAVERQVGALFVIGGKVLGLEAFGSPETFGRFFTKLVRSYALDAIDGEEQSKTTVAPDAARRFLESAIRAKSETHRSVGLGETLAFDSRILSGLALVNGGRVLHLSAFRKETDKTGEGPLRYQRFSHRRQRRFD